MSVMSYMTGLRSWKDQNDDKNNRPSFTTIPFKERKKNPMLIKKVYFVFMQDFIQKIKNIEEE